MVGWYDPMQLIHTGGDVAASTLFGRRADYRLLEALAAHDPPATVQCPPNGELWIDYVADVGDGWNSTYAVASTLALDELRLPVGDDADVITRRGAVLVFGGDQVYPVASHLGYAQRTVAPYEAALPHTDAPHPIVRAVPGNHDWYDNLVSFVRLFGAHDWFAGWQARQQRSYFALKLPHGWWLIGTDIQLDSDIDQPQIDYFRSLASEMGSSDRIILCNAEPHWIYAHIYGAMNPDYSDNNLAFLEEKVFGKRVAVFLAGDLHHYRRHEATDGRQKITAGGGGAFLHPTHGPDVSSLEDGFTLRTAFPSTKTSRRLCWRNLLFLFRNPFFGSVSGILYLLASWSVVTNMQDPFSNDLAVAIGQAANAALRSPLAVFWIVVLFLGFWLFTDTHSRSYRMIAGTVHGAIHLTAAFLISWWATRLTVPLTFGSTSQLLWCGALIVVFGWVVGSIIMGLYLLVSLNGFARHSNEAFSALRIEDWKNFLRLRIDERGELTIFPIGIRRVPRRWKRRESGDRGPQFVAKDLKATPPELIEPPVEVRYRSPGGSMPA
jgi:hypothetical protein